MLFLLHFFYFLFCSFCFFFLFCFYFIHFHVLIFLIVSFSLFHLVFWNETKKNPRGRKLTERIKQTMMAKDWHTHAQPQYIRSNDGKTHMFRLCHMIGHETSITFHRKTWQGACLVFMLSSLKKATTKTYFLYYDIWVKTLKVKSVYHIIHAITLGCFHIVVHGYVASFLIKTCFYETITIF